MLRIHFTDQDLMRVRLAARPDPGWEAALSAHRTGRPVDPEAIAPYWPVLRRVVDADLAARARTLTADGTAALLGSLHPAVTWRDPVLSVACAADRDLHLAGRGLTLQPAYFCPRTPVVPADTGRAPVLVYPVPQHAAWPTPAGTEQRGRALAALLGRTRAAALHALAGSVTTSDLARRIGVSLPSASEHAAVLRAAGLVASRRERNSVWHVLTPLGRAVLDAEGPRPHGTGTSSGASRTDRASRRAVSAAAGSPAAS